MGNEEKHNIFGEVNIKIELNKACYLPGEDIKGSIILTPKSNLVEEVINNPILRIKITQYQLYTKHGGRSSKKEKEKKILYESDFNFNDFLEKRDSKGFNIPINIPLFEDAYPSIYFSKEDYVKHYLCIEYPHFKVKRTIMFIVKNKINLNDYYLIAPFKIEETYNKSKFIFDKGFCVLTVNMPKNYFEYNEAISFNIKLNCKNLKLRIEQFQIKVCRHECKNYPNYRLNSKEKTKINLFWKYYKFYKNQDIYEISDYFYFPNFYQNSKLPCNPNQIYKEYDLHGPFEINETNLYNLKPSALGGLLSVKYFFKIKVFFKSFWTMDEKYSIPIYFFSKKEDPKIGAYNMNNDNKDLFQNDYNFEIKKNINNDINQINSINDKFNKNSEVTTQDNEYYNINEVFEPAPTFINANLNGKLNKK